MKECFQECLIYFDEAKPSSTFHNTYDFYLNGAQNTSESEFDLDLQFFQHSGQWTLETPVKLTLDRDTIGYHLMTLKLVLKRNPDYYVLVIILPVILLTLLSFLMFLQPFNGGEKVTTGLTVFFSFVVELLVVSEVLPPTGPDDLPIIAELISVLIVMVFSSVSVVSVLTSVHANHTKFPKFWKMFLKLKAVKFLYPSKDEFRHFTVEKTMAVIKQKVAKSEKEKRAVSCLVQRIDTFPRTEQNYLAENSKQWMRLAEVLNRFCFIIYSITLTVILTAYIWQNC